MIGIKQMDCFDSTRLDMTQDTSPSDVHAYLKWGNDIIGLITEDNRVLFSKPNHNPVVSILTKGNTTWSPEEYMGFLSDRIVGKNRRDIEKILFRAGLVEYDVIKLAELTYALNPKDLLWISPSEDMKIENALGGTFESIFRESLDETGNTVHSPDGQNIKNYGVSNGTYGIYKKRLNSLMTDAESEVAAYRLSELFGVKVCPAWFVTKDIIFSRFMYEFTTDFMVHVRHYFRQGERTEDLYRDLIEKFPYFHDDIDKMCLFDLITRQDDRHMSNYAILNTISGSRFYPLYDNGRSLFYDCSEEVVTNCLKNPILGCTTFGEVGSYYDVAEQIAQKRKISDLINLDIDGKIIYDTLLESGFKGYRLEGNCAWITETLKILRGL